MAIVEENSGSETLLRSAERAIERADWAGFRSAIAGLREQLLPRYSSADEGDQRVREIVDALVAVSPAHDPEGCRGELAELRELLRLQPRSAPASVALPPPLDLRGLQPPQPIVQILDALDRAPNESLRVVLPHEPQPLYDLLRRRGFQWSGAQRADGGFELTIRRPPHA